LRSGDEHGCEWALGIDASSPVQYAIFNADRDLAGHGVDVSEEDDVDECFTWRRATMGEGVVCMVDLRFETQAGSVIDKDRRGCSFVS